MANLTVELRIGGKKRGLGLLIPSHPILSRMTPRHYISMWRDVERRIRRFTREQFDTGGFAEGGGIRSARGWTSLKDATVRDRAKSRGYYKVPSGEGPERKVGVWTGETRDKFIFAKSGIEQGGARYRKETAFFPKAVVFHHGRRRGRSRQPARRVWNTEAMKALVLDAWAAWIERQR